MIISTFECKSFIQNSDITHKIIQSMFHCNRAYHNVMYMVTIHKSQGSEYDIVVMPLTNANYIMLQRNLLYTGVTRAKKVFVLFGQKQAVAKAVKTLKVVKRNTRLSGRIIDAAGIMAYTLKTA